jgi:hypothetical protein
LYAHPSILTTRGGHTEQVAQKHYWTLTDNDLDIAIQKLSPKLAQLNVSKSLDSSLNDSEVIGAGTKKAQEIQGFDAICRLLASLGETLIVDDIGLEPTTPTMSTSESIDENPAKQRGKHEDTERLHQCLHQIGQLTESYGPESLADALAQLLGEESFERLADAISRRVANG